VQVSLDGDKYFHNLHRKTYYGKPTYSIVLNNIKKLLNNGVKVLPMITATDDNVNDFSKILYSIINELKITDYAVNILITKSFNISNDYAGKLATEMLKAYESFGHIANDYVFVELYNKLLGIDKTISKNSCGSSRKITVFPNGKVYACQAMEKVKENAMGTINDEFISDSNWDCWRNRSRFDNPECLNCECVMSCGGGCATGSYNINGSIYDIDKNNCEYTRELFKKIHHI
jgi:radical SAM protein with 4Fe4S-binding SPASM domain